MIGEIVEFREHGNVVCARVTVPGERARVITETGREMNLPAGRIVHRTGQAIEGSPTPEQAAEVLLHFAAAAEARREAVDLERLWEQTADAGKVLSLEQLAERALGAADAEASSAVLRELAADSQLFRQARGGFAARTRDEVERVRREERQRRQEEARRKGFAAWLAAAVDTGQPGPLPAGAEDFLDRLAGYAAAGPEGRPTLELDLLSRAGLPAEQATPDRVFQLLVSAGVFSEHENLLLRKHERRIAFPAEVEQAAAAAAQAGCSGSARAAAPDTPLIFTVDDAETLEIDDAIQLLGRRDDGGWRVAVYIADPDALVPAGGPIDEEAALRGSTLYLPDRRIPMLPTAICDDAASLIAGASRPAIRFTLEIGPDGELNDSPIDAVTVVVGQRRTFDDVEQGLAAGDPELNELLACADALRGARYRAGAYLLNQPDVMPRVDAQGRITLKRYVSASPAGRLVAELMVASNRSAARLCEVRGVAAPYRCQGARGKPPPPPPPGSEYDPMMLQTILNALDRSETRLQPGRHTGLAAECYLQITSPLRRYVDLLGQRQLKAALADAAPPYRSEQLRDRVAASERLAGECRKIEAWARGYTLLRYLGERTGERCTGVVLRRVDERVAIEIVEYAYRTTFRPQRKVRSGESLALEITGTDPRAGKLMLAEIPD